MRALSLALPFAAAIAVPAHAQALVSQQHNLPPMAGPAPAAAYTNGVVVQRNRAVTAQDVSKNAPIFDPRGYRIGRVEAVEASGVVVSYSGGRTKVPFQALRRDEVLRVQMASHKFREVAARHPY